MRERDLGNWQDALILFDEARRLEPNEGGRVRLYGRRRFPNYVPSFYVGEALFKLGDYTHGIQMWEVYETNTKYRDALNAEQREVIRIYRDAFARHLYPAMYGDLAGELVRARASLRALQPQREAMGQGQWEELERRLREPDTGCREAISKNATFPADRLGVIRACLDRVEDTLANLEGRQDPALVRTTQLLLENAVFMLVELRREAAGLAMTVDTSPASVAAATRAVVARIESSGCPPDTPRTLEKLEARTRALLGPERRDLLLHLAKAQARCADFTSVDRLVVEASRSPTNPGPPPTPPAPTPKPSPGQDLKDLYKKKYALLVGVWNYDDKGWPPLEGVPKDIDAVGTALRELNYEVEVEFNPTREGLEKTLRTFLGKRGGHSDNQVLVYYAGHGAKDPNRPTEKELGFMVPRDAPAQGKGRGDEPWTFTAVSLGWLLTVIDQVEARHAFFVFDSCFAGSIFGSPLGGVIAALPEESSGGRFGAVARGVRPVETDPRQSGSGSPRNPDPYIDHNLSTTVRWYLTAGTAKEKAADRSRFCEAFVAGLRGRAVSQRPGLLTTTELSSYVRERVISQRKPNEEKQTPLYGPIGISLQIATGEILFQIRRPQAAFFGAPRLVADR